VELKFLDCLEAALIRTGCQLLCASHQGFGPRRDRLASCKMALLIVLSLPKCFPLWLDREKTNTSRRITVRVSDPT
jgi:hypothetical protein